MTVRWQRVATVLVLTAAVAALGRPGAAKAAEPAGKKEIVARVGPIEIDRATFEAELVRAPGDSAKSPEQERREFMDAFLNRQLLVLAARDAGYFKPDPMRDYMINGYEESMLTTRIRDEDVVGKVHLTPAQVDSFHARQKTLYDINQILLATPEEAETAKARLAAGEDFGKVAEEMSVDEKSRYKEGHLEPFVWGLTNRSFLDALDKLAPGEIGGPIKSEVGYHLIRMNGRPPNTNYKPLAEQQALIAQRATTFAQMDTLAAHNQYLQETYHFAPNWPVVNRLCQMYTTAIDKAVRENPTTPRDDQYEIAKRSLVFPESLQAQSIATWDMGRYLVKEQLEMILDLPGLAIADRRNPNFVVLDAASVFRRAGEVAEARKRGYDKDPELRRMVERKREELAVNDYFQKELVEKATFDSTAEKAYYEANKDRYTYEPQVKLACIQYQGDPQAAAAMEEALRSPTGKPDSLLAEHDKRGLIRARIPEGKWFLEPQYPILYERAAAMPKGAVGRVLDEEGYWTVFVVLDHQEGKLLPFAEVQKTVQTSLRNQKSDELLKQRLTELKAKYPIWKNEAYLAGGGSD